MSIWPQKPPLGSKINWGHPLSQGLVGCWLMNEAGGNLITNICNKKVNTDATGFLWSPSGVQTVGGLAGDFPIKPGMTWCQNPGVSVVARCKVPNAKSKSLIYLYGGGSIRLVLGTSDYDNGLIKWIGDRVYSSPWGVYINNNLSTGSKKYQIAATALGTNANIYQDSILKDSKTNCSPYGGESYYSLGIDWQADIDYIYVWNRYLSQADIQSLYVNPYQFIYRPSSKTYSIPSGNIIINADTLALTLSEETTSVKYDYINLVSALSLSLSLISPANKIGVITAANTLALTLASLTPSIEYDYVQAVSTLTLALSALDPTIYHTSDVTVLANTLALTLASLSPTIAFDMSIAVTALNLSLAILAPSILTNLGRTGFKYDSTNHWITFYVEGIEVLRLKQDGSISVHGGVNANDF